VVDFKELWNAELDRWRARAGDGAAAASACDIALDQGISRKWTWPLWRRLKQLTKPETGLKRSGVLPTTSAKRAGKAERDRPAIAAGCATVHSRTGSRTAEKTIAMFWRAAYFRMSDYILKPRGGSNGFEEALVGRAA